MLHLLYVLDMRFLYSHVNKGFTIKSDLWSNRLLQLSCRMFFHSQNNIKSIPPLETYQLNDIYSYMTDFFI
jgi:hypothetical protein